MPQWPEISVRTLSVHFPCQLKRLRVREDGVGGKLSYRMCGVARRFFRVVLHPRFGYVFVELLFDTADKRSFQRLEQKTEIDIETHFRRSHVHLAMDAGALKPQRIRMPLALEVMLSAKLVGDFLHESARIRERKVVTPDKCDIGHRISPSAEARS